MLPTYEILLFLYGALNIVLGITLAVFFMGAVFNVKGIGKGIIPILIPSLLVLETSRVLLGIIWLNSNITVDESSWGIVAASMVLRMIGITGLWIVNVKFYKRFKRKQEEGGHRDVK